MKSLRVLYLGTDSPEGSQLAEVLDEARVEPFEFRWEWRYEDALARLAEEECDALILALPRPEATVSEALAGVRAVRPRLAVVACTPEGARDLGREALERGAVDHVVLERLDPDTVLRSLKLAVATTRLAETRERLEAVVEADAEKKHEGFRDPITGLPSRELFMERLGRAIARAATRGREPYAVLVLDLDRFQAVNDGLGHEAGDRLLAEVTERLAHCLGSGDTLTRLGSDKFAMLLDAIERPSDALRVAERACELLEHPFVLDGAEIFVTAGIGIALASPAYEKPEDAMRDAYSAMHRAKEAGGTSYEVFDPEVQARSVARLRLETDLRRALERDELVLHYQPIVSMESGSITGFEALLRWQSPERGLVPPGEFVRVAEETGLIVPIGRWVLDEACRTVAGWRDRYSGASPLNVAVNLSARQFAEPDLAEEVEETMRSFELAPDALKLEITESVLMESSADNQAQLHRLCALGVELSIDDFGTGYSSLSSLHRFPIETLKIDRTFVGRMEFEDENSEIVKTIVNLGRNLDMDVVAEGVETPAQLEQLRGLGCHMGQGFLFSNAVDAEAAASWLETAPRW